MQKKNVAKRVKNYEKLPLYFYVFLGLAVLSLILYVIAAANPSFANFFNGTVGGAVRAALAWLTSVLPFSLGEMLLYAIPLLVIGVGMYAYRCRCETWKSTFVFLGSVVSVFSLLFSLFVFTLGTGYHTDPLDRRLGMQGGEISREELYDTALWLTEEVNKAANGVTFGQSGFSVMPYDRGKMNELLLTAYDPVCDAYSFVQRMDSRIKPVMASKLMSYTHITGVYSYFTGEANLNTAFPDYTLPFTAAHELAHQRGIARENEANFIAFLVTATSEDPYIRYSGYLNLWEYVMNALYPVDGAGYKEILGMLDERIVGELKAYSAFFDTYRDAVIADVSSAVNDTYLKLHGNEAGVESYGLVVDLAIAYRRRVQNG